MNGPRWWAVVVPALLGCIVAEGHIMPNADTAGIAQEVINSAVEAAEEHAYYEDEEEDPCVCAIFLSRDLGITEPGNQPIKPLENPTLNLPVVYYKTDKASLPCGAIGNERCANRCDNLILKFLARAGPSVICGAVERPVHGEHAYLYIKNCDDKWLSTSLAAGVYCCNNGAPEKC